QENRVVLTGSPPCRWRGPQARLYAQSHFSMEASQPCCKSVETASCEEHLPLSPLRPECARPGSSRQFKTSSPEQSLSPATTVTTASRLTGPPAYWAT